MRDDMYHSRPRTRRLPKIKKPKTNLMNNPSTPLYTHRNIYHIPKQVEGRIALLVSHLRMLERQS